MPDVPARSQGSHPLPTTPVEPVSEAAVGQERGDLAVFYSRQVEFAVPYPPPELLRAYDEIVPGSAREILDRSKAEMEFRHDMDRKAIEAGIEDDRADRREAMLGQIFAWLIGTTAIISGSVVAVQGQPWAGGFIGAGGVIGLVSVFIYGRRKQIQLEEPEPEPPPAPKKRPAKPKSS